MHNYHEIIRQQVHDFKNHIRTIDGMLDDNTNAKKYTQELLATSYLQAKLCHCGNDIIDSIINCKEAEARESDIHFDYQISLSSPLKIESIDICAILSNQIDNAIEACLKIDKNKERKIFINIAQKEHFLFFSVKNSAKDNPFNKSKELITTKNNDSQLHGFGVRIIRETTEKYNGKFDNYYNDGIFNSNVMLLDAV